jgi:outer membrane protein TolC
MPFQSRPCARALLMAALVIGAATSGLAQSPSSSPVSPVQTPPAAPATQTGAQTLATTGPTRSLSIDEAVQLALQQNLGIQIERLNPQLQDYTIAQALANYTPIVGAGANWRNQDSPPSSFLSGGSTTITDENYGFQTQYAQLFPWGTNAIVSFDSARATTNNIFNSFNPTLTGNLDLTVTQPLLRNFRYDTVKQQIYVGRKDREIADVDLQQSIALTTRTVKNAYWDYVFSINSLQVARQSLDLAQESLRNTRSRVEIGTLAPIDIVQAESEVASREEAVILAEAAIGQSEDQLRSIIFDPKTPDFWTMSLQPTDTAPFQLQAVDVPAAVSRALGERTDLIGARKRLEITDYNLKYFKNQTLPNLDIRFDYNSTGLGGTQLIRDPESPVFPPPVIGEAQRSYGDLLSDVFSNAFPTYVLSLNVTYPIGRSIADASLARTKIEKSQSDISLRQLELQVTQQVRDAARQLIANSKRVNATTSARVLAERRLEAEEKKFEAGMSTSFEVFQAQRDLSEARSNELRAVLDYNKSQVDFETVQIAPTGGAASFAPTTDVTTTLGGAVTGATAGAVSGATPRPQP